MSSPTTRDRRSSAHRVDVEGVAVDPRHYIDGERVASAETFEVRSPIDWDDVKLADLARGGAPEVDAAVAAARRAFPAWAALGPEGRAEPLRRLAALAVPPGCVGAARRWRGARPGCACRPREASLARTSGASRFFCLPGVS